MIQKNDPDDVDVDAWDIDKVPVIHLQGSSYQIGCDHGTLLREAVHSQLAVYEGIFETNCKLSWEEVRDVAAKYQPTIQKLAPHLFEEMRGIVDGVNAVGTTIPNSAVVPDVKVIDILDIIALNARSEIALGQWDDGCTALAWNLGGLSSVGVTAGDAEAKSGKHKRVLAQNWDWRTSVGPNLALASIKQYGKPDIWMVMEAGIVGKIGFNSSSVGVCLNAIRARPTDETLLPVHLILRLLLEQSSLDDALALISSLGGCASSQHILIASPSGSRGLEVSPKGTVQVLEDDSGLLVHTNHFLENRLVDEPPWLPGSPVRLDRARTLCAELVKHYGKDKVREKLSPAVLRQKVFADTFNSPQAICCTPDPCREESIETLFNIVMVFEEGKKPRGEVVFGRPARSGAKVYHMPA